MVNTSLPKEYGVQRCDTTTTKLVDAPRCIDAIFHEEARPGLRTWMDWKAKGYLPFVRVGRRVFYDPTDCRTALEKRFTIRAR